MKDAALLTLFQHEDIAVHLIGWGIPVFIALFTMLYKGIWKSINSNDDAAHLRMDDLEDDLKGVTKDLNRLLGEHSVRHPNWDGQERRTNPNRSTHPDYRPKEILKDEPKPEIFGTCADLDWDKGDQGDGRQP